MFSKIYYYFLLFIIVSKVFWFFSTLRLKYDTIFHKKELEVIKKRNEVISYFSEMTMYILLLILFFPYFTPEKVLISGNEKEILFILGIVGIMHLGVLKL